MWALRDARVRFGATTALDSVDLEVHDGETLVVLGPSGCGKSTLLRVLAGLQPLDDGVVEIDGTDATGLDVHRRGMAMVFQDPTLFPHRTVAGNVEFGLRMQGRPASTRRARVEELLALVGLEGFGTRRPDTLSGGEAQRVALARALAPAPRLVLLDEPLAALDRARRDQLVADLPGVLAAAATTAVHVTHDHTEAFALADRIAVMSAGRILRVGPPEEVWADPRTETVARFLGHTNIVTDGDGLRVLRRDAATITPDGELEAVVVDSRFGGDHHDLTVRVGADELRFRVDRGAAPGTPLRLHIDPDRVARVSPD